MNRKLKAYRQSNRKTAAMQLTDRINAAVNEENIKGFAETNDTLVFCADCLGVSLGSGYGEKAAIRLENKLERAQ